MSLAAVIGGLLGAGSSALGSMMSYKSAKKLQNHQYELNNSSIRLNTPYLLENIPSYERIGYEKAGYNPLLALGSSSSMPSPGFSANSSGVSSDLGSSVSSGINSALVAKQNKATVENIKADTSLKNQQGETEKARRVQMDFQNAMLDVQKHLADKDLSTYERRFYSDLYEQFQRAENYRANSAIGMMNAQTNRMNYQVNSANAATNKQNADIARYNAETNRNRKSIQIGKFGYSFSHR